MTRLLTACLLLVLGAGCQRPTKTTQTAAVAVDSVAGAERDVWERARQCAADADRLASRYQREAARWDRGPQVSDWTNHYNRKELRCYVEIIYNNQSASGSKSPIFYRELFDAIEGFRLASHTRPGLDEEFQSLWCVVANPDKPRETRPATCPAAEQFIAERMTN